MEKSKINVLSKSLADVLGEFSSGVVKIPRFQRDYVWERPRVAKLFDSIYKGFPVGSLFYWITPREYKDHFRELPELKLKTPEDYEQIKMILDGQQRLTSLHIATKGLMIRNEDSSPKDYSKICFNFETQSFESSKLKEDLKKRISASRFFDNEKFQEAYDMMPQEQRVLMNKCRNILHTYPISIIEVKDMDLEDAIEIFERINQGGKRLKLFDLVVANTWTENFDLKIKSDELITEIKKSGFGEIDEEVIAQTLSLLVKNGCTKSYQLQITEEEMVENWKDVSDGVKLAVDYLRSNLGVKIYDFLPYSSMVPLLAYLFVKIDRRSLSAMQSKFVHKWFWVSAFTQRYGSSALTTMGADKENYFKPLAEGSDVSFDHTVTINKAELKKLTLSTNSAAKNAILCILALNEPKHFANGSTITLDTQLCSSFNEKEMHHIFPNAYLKTLGINSTKRNLLLNFAFIPGELNREISDDKPSDYFSTFKNNNKRFDLILDSHLIPGGEDSAIWSDSFEDFLDQRADQILNKIKKYVEQQEILSNPLEDSEAETIKDVEIRIRSFVDEKLNYSDEDYWTKIPSDILEVVKERMDAHIKNNPGDKNKKFSNLEKFGFCDVMHLSKIVLKNWNIFEDDFKSKPNVEKYLRSFNDYRNAIMHSRTSMTNITRKEGEAAIDWITQIIDTEGE